MTAPTPTEGIEPTIERIAHDVCREYLGNILGRAVGLPPPVAKEDPTIEDHDPPWDGQYGPAKAREQLIAQQRAHHDEVQATKDRVRAEVNAEWAEAIRPHRAWGEPDLSPRAAADVQRWAESVHETDAGYLQNLAEEKGAAVHQSRVDALREAATEADDDTKLPASAGVRRLWGNWLRGRADRLEREQAKTAPTPADAKCEEPACQHCGCNLLSEQGSCVRCVREVVIRDVPSPEAKGACDSFKINNASDSPHGEETGLCIRCGHGYLEHPPKPGTPERALYDDLGGGSRAKVKRYARGREEYGATFAGATERLRRVQAEALKDAEARGIAKGLEMAAAEADRAADIAEHYGSPQGCATATVIAESIRALQKKGG